MLKILQVYSKFVDYSNEEGISGDEMSILLTMGTDKRIWGSCRSSHSWDGSIVSHIIRLFMAIRRQICSGFTILSPKTESA